MTMVSFARSPWTGIMVIWTMCMEFQMTLSTWTSFFFFDRPALRLVLSGYKPTKPASNGIM